jgi:hypothetical protein
MVSVNAKADRYLQRAKALTPVEVVILRASPYDKNGVRWKQRKNSATARQLACEDLLEEDPTARGYYRITPLGERVLKMRAFLDQVRGV